MARIRAERFVDIDTASARNSLVGKDLQQFLDVVAPKEQSQTPVFNANGTIDTITIYRSLTKNTANRLALTSFTYDAELNPITETTNLYDPSDGNTLLKTINITYTWVNSELTNVERTTT